jgi:hypothetical protein
MLRALLALALALPLAAAGCTASRPPDGGGPVAPPVDAAPEPPPAIGTPFTLARGETTTLDGIEIGFAAVLEDSRCPTGVTCVWEGRASINLSLTRAGQTGGVNLEIPGGTGRDDTERHRPVEALGYRFTLLALDPYPTAEGGPAPAPRATLLMEPPGDD